MRLVPDSTAQPQGHHAGGPRAGRAARRRTADDPPVPDARARSTPPSRTVAAHLAATGCSAIPPRPCTGSARAPTRARARRARAAQGARSRASRSCCSSPAARWPRRGAWCSRPRRARCRTRSGPARSRWCCAAAKGGCPTSSAGREGGIAVRHTSHRGIARLVARTGEPLTSTSANRPGRPAGAGSRPAGRAVPGARCDARRAAGARRRRARQRAAVDAGGLHRSGAAHGARGRDPARGAAAGRRAARAVTYVSAHEHRTSSSSAPATPAAARWPRRSARGASPRAGSIRSRSRRPAPAPGTARRCPRAPTGRAGAWARSERPPRAPAHARARARRRPDPHHVRPPPRPGRRARRRGQGRICSAPTPAARRAGPRSAIPYGSDLASYRATFAELQELIGAVVSRVAGTVR